MHMFYRSCLQDLESSWGGLDFVLSALDDILDWPLLYRVKWPSSKSFKWHESVERLSKASFPFEFLFSYGDTYASETAMISLGEPLLGMEGSKL